MSDHEIRLGDCLAGLRGLGDKSVDHFVFDAPYSERIHKNIGAETRNDGASSRADITFAALTADVAQAVADQIVRLTRRWILAFGDEWSFALWRDCLVRAGADYVRFGLWVKTDAMPQLSGDGPATPAEHLCIAHSADRAGRKRWSGGGKPGRWTGPAQERAVSRVHATQKPEWLMEALVRDFTDPGELICDPFAGSGTTGVACKRLGRRFIGWERDPKFHAAAVKRLDATQQQYELLARGPKPKQGRFLLDPEAA